MHTKSYEKPYCTHRFRQRFIVSESLVMAIISIQQAYFHQSFLPTWLKYLKFFVFCQYRQHACRDAVVRSVLFPKGSISFLETLPHVHFPPILFLPMNSNIGNAIVMHIIRFRCCLQSIKCKRNCIYLHRVYVIEVTTHSCFRTF